MGRVANVFYQGKLAGEIEQTDDHFIFAYSREYLAGGVPLSFQLPLQQAPFVSKTLLPFFENLVAEGWLRQLQSQQQKINESDRFGLLLANGRDLVGAVTVEPKD